MAKKESTVPSQDVYPINGFYIAYATDADEFNKECDKAFKEGFSPAPGEPYQTYHIKGVLHFVQTFVKIEGGQMERNWILLSNIRSFRLLCEEQPKEFNTKVELLLEEGYRPIEPVKVKVGTDKEEFTKLFYTVMLIKYDKSSIILPGKALYN